MFRQNQPMRGGDRRVNSEILDRMPPSSLASEREVIGSILIDPRIVDDVAETLKPDDFYCDAHQVIFAHLRGMGQAEAGIDAELLLDRLRTSGDFERVGGSAYLAEVITSVAVSAHWRYHAAIVLRESKRRQIIHAATEMLRSAYDDATPDDTLATAEMALQAIETGDYQTKPVGMDVACVRALEAVEKQIRDRTKPGVMIGLEKFDEQIGGVFPSELVILGARTTNGKSSLARQIAHHMASRGRTVLIQSVEMNTEEVATAQLCTVSGVSNQLIRTGQADLEHLRKLVDAASYVGKPNLVIDDNPSPRPYDIARSVRRIKPDVLIVDYLQIVIPDNARDKQRYQQVGDIVRSLRQIARTRNIPVLVLAQIGRGAERENDTPPEMRHLRESGDIEQDSDMILLLWRPKHGIPVGKDGGYQPWHAELEVAKNRKGWTGVIKLLWDGERTAFDCYSPSGPWSPDSWVSQDAEDF